MSSNPIYSKIEYTEAINTKRNILESEAALLKSIQRLNNYKALRKRELMFKIKLKKTVKETQDLVKEILKNVPKISKKELNKIDENDITSSKKSKNLPSTIESELAEIQRKLQDLV